MKSYLLSAALFFLLIASARAGLQIISATNLTIVGEFAAIPIYFFNSPSQWNITGELIPLEKADRLDDLTNKIIFVPRVWHWRIDVALDIQKKGALGILAQSHNYFSKSKLSNPTLINGSVLTINIRSSRRRRDVLRFYS